MDDIVDIIRGFKPGDTGIVYCLSKNRCEEMVMALP